MMSRMTLIGRVACAILPLACAPAPRSHAIEIREFKYAPASLKVRKGDTLVFANRDIVPHTATARDTSWNTGDIPARTSARIVVSSGADYFCIYHPTMTASIELP